MKSTYGVLFLAVAVWLALAGCSDTPTDPAHEAVGAGEETDLGLSERDVDEAAQIAMCVSGELRPPRDLVHRIGLELRRVRATFRTEVPQLTDLRFGSPLLAGSVMLRFDEETARRVADGTYTAWDALNAEYGMTPRASYGADPVWYYLRSEQILHPLRLVELYRDLPGVTAAHRNHRAFAGFDLGSSLFPMIETERSTYLFMTNSVRGPAMDYWYVEVVEGKARLIGHRRLGEELPEWWEDAEANFDLWRKWLGS